MSSEQSNPAVPEFSDDKRTARLAKRTAPLAGLSSRDRAVLWAAFSIGGILTAASILQFGVLHAGSEGFQRLFGHWIFNAIFVLAAVLALAGARRPATGRRAWTLIAIGISATALGFIAYTVFVLGDATPPYPSIGDFFWLGQESLIPIGLFILVRPLIPKSHPSRWLDGIAGFLTFAALSVTLVFAPTIASATGGTAAIVTSLAYPVLDLVTAGFAILLFSLVRRSLSPALVVLGLALLVLIGSDFLYFRQVAAGTYMGQSLVDTGYALTSMLIAAAAWQSRGEGPSTGASFPEAEVLPVACSAIAIGVLAYDSLGQVAPVATVLALLALGAAGLRFWMNSREVGRLRQLASYDSLTGLLSRRAFDEALDRVMAESREGDQIWSVVLFDLDGLKQVNDLRGHAEGDRALREAGRAIRRACRPPDLAARIGGDEFAILLPGSGSDAAERIGRRICLVIESIGEGIGASFGVAEWPADGPSAELVMLRADVGLYAAKGTGGQALPEPSARQPVPTNGDATRPSRTGEHSHRAQLRIHEQEVRDSYGRKIHGTEEKRALGVVGALAAAVEEKDYETAGHIFRVRDLGLLLAAEIAPDNVDDPQLSYGFLLHDIGKLGVPDHILRKPGRLTGEEWIIMKRHPEVGARIIEELAFLDRAREVVLHHHERWDGRGYPGGLAGEEIPLWCRIFAIADTIDAMTSDRPYGPALRLEVAVEEVRRMSGSQFDPACVQAFLRLDREAVRAALAAHDEVSAVRIANGVAAACA